MKFKRLIIGTLVLLTMEAYCENLINIGSNTVNVVFADDFSFQIGTNIIEVTFADSQLQVGTKTAMCTELQRVFAFASSTTDVFQEEIEGALKLKRMSLETYPESISNGTLNFCRSNSVNACLVSGTLSDAFTEKAAMLSEHTNAVSALETMISTINSESFTNLTIQAKLDMFWPPNTVQGQPSQETLSELETVLFSPVRANTLFMPSLFGIANGFELAGENVSCSLFTTCVAKDKTTGQIKNYPIGYVNGKWRLFFGL